VQTLIAAHNSVRDTFRLPRLEWDCKLGSEAQRWAKNGRFLHSSTQLGENLFVSSNAAEPVESVVAKWLGEKRNYDEKSGECRPGTVCTHFTQLVWRATKYFGCGVNRNAEKPWKMLVVCHYSPAGNTGGRPF
jgi:uncharacterized protein YkwD